MGKKYEFWRVVDYLIERGRHVRLILYLVTFTGLFAFLPYIFLESQLLAEFYRYFAQDGPKWYMIGQILILAATGLGFVIGLKLERYAVILASLTLDVAAAIVLWAWFARSPALLLYHYLYVPAITFFIASGLGAMLRKILNVEAKVHLE